MGRFSVAICLIARNISRAKCINAGRGGGTSGPIALQLLEKHLINRTISHFVCRDVEKIRAGIAEQASHFLFMVFGFVVFIVIAFVYGWKLSLMVCAYLPILIITSVIIGKV